LKRFLLVVSFFLYNVFFSFIFLLMSNFVIGVFIGVIIALIIDFLQGFIIFIELHQFSLHEFLLLFEVGLYKVSFLLLLQELLLGMQLSLGILVEFDFLGVYELVQYGF
jgi:hypothetical protein